MKKSVKIDRIGNDKFENLFGYMTGTSLGISSEHTISSLVTNAEIVIDGDRYIITRSAGTHVPKSSIYTLTIEK